MQVDVLYFSPKLYPLPVELTKLMPVECTVVRVGKFGNSTGELYNDEVGRERAGDEIHRA